MKLLCNACGTATRQGYRFCGQCGAELTVKICPECKLEIPRAAEKCPHCHEEQATLRNALIGLATLVAIALFVWKVVLPRL